jgi:hypothetical protein
MVNINVNFFLHFIYLIIFSIIIMFEKEIY